MCPDNAFVGDGHIIYSMISFENNPQKEWAARVG